MSEEWVYRTTHRIVQSRWLGREIFTPKRNLTLTPKGCNDYSKRITTPLQTPKGWNYWLFMARMMTYQCFGNYATPFRDHIQQKPWHRWPPQCQNRRFNQPFGLLTAGNAQNSLLPLCLTIHRNRNRTIVNQRNLHIGTKFATLGWNSRELLKRIQKSVV